MGGLPLPFFSCSTIQGLDLSSSEASQVGFLGCLSTVSTLMVEVHVLVTAKTAQWRAYAYLYIATLLPSIVLAILLYCIPVWVYNVAESGYNKV